MWYFHLGHNAWIYIALFIFKNFTLFTNTVFIPIVAIAPIGEHPSKIEIVILSHEGLDLYLWSFFNWSALDDFLSTLGTDWNKHGRKKKKTLFEYKFGWEKVMDYVFFLCIHWR